jgi:hypothetical protein
MWTLQKVKSHVNCCEKKFFEHENPSTTSVGCISAQLEVEVIYSDFQIFELVLNRIPNENMSTPYTSLLLVVTSPTRKFFSST